MSIAELNTRVASYLRGKPDASFGLTTDLPGLWLFERGAPSAVECALYLSYVGFTLQGEKRVHWGAKYKDFRVGDSAMVSQDLPVNAQITKATAAMPYRAIGLLIDFDLLRELQDDAPAAEEGPRETIHSVPADPAIVEAMLRYFALLDDPASQPVMVPLILRELHFRLLVSPHGYLLRHVLQRDSNAARIRRAIAHLRENFRSHVAVDDLCRIAGMSPSSFYAQFRSVTETSPLQFLKELRLIEAQRLMLFDGLSVSSAAFEVGYESPSQFSREYARRFGSAPRAHRNKKARVGK